VGVMVGLCEVIMELSLLQELAALARESLRESSTIRTVLAELLHREVRRERLEGRCKSDLGHFEGQVYSQNGEDGIIEEIFRRIGLTNQYFVEVAAGDGMENNTTKLLCEKWTGLWVESDQARAASINRIFAEEIRSEKLKFHEGMITAENIEELLRTHNVPSAMDLLSIDIDGNDFWVWKALDSFRPRVVVVEFNASMGPTTDWVVVYDPAATWDGTSYHGASLKALETLGRSKGYQLVGCNLTGVNAFFIRTDCLGDIVWGDGRSETFFHPPAYCSLVKCGHPRGYGPFCRASDIISR